jgi:hypothetical protein
VWRSRRCGGPGGVAVPAVWRSRRCGGPGGVAVPAVWQSGGVAVPVARSALSGVITEYFWVYASGIFRDHESGPAAWGRRARPTQGETAPGESAPGSQRQGNPCRGSQQGGHSGVSVRRTNKSPRAALVWFTQPRPTAAPQRFTPRRAQPLRETEGEPHGDRLDGPISPGVRCLPSIRRSPSCGT